MFKVTLGRTIFLVVLAGLSLVVFSFSPKAEAAPGINAQIPFYGVLNDDKGKPLTGTYGMVFRIYDAPTGGAVLWTGTYTGVLVEGGEFSVMLGSGTGSELTLDFNDDSYYLGVTVGTDSEMVPRERLGASPYAMNAGRLGGLIASDFLRTGSLLSVTESTTTPLLSLTQSGSGNFMSLYDAIDTEVFSVQSSGEVIGTKFQSTLDEVNIFAGALEVLSEGPSTFGGNIVVADGSGVFFGNGSGVFLSQSLSAPAELVFGGVESSNEVNLVGPGTFGIFAGGSVLRDPGFIFNADGSVDMYSRSASTPENSVLRLDFMSGVEVTSGNVRIVDGGLRVDNLAQDTVPAYLMSDTQGNIIASPALTLDVDGNVHIQDKNLIIDGGGIKITNLAGSGPVPLGVDDNGNVVIDSSSDERLKQNIHTIDNALDILLNLRGVRYEWRDTERFGTQTEVGFIAQELQEELPEVVRDTGEYLSVNTKNITAVIVEAVKEMYGEMEEYFSRTERLEREVEFLRQEVEALKGDRQVNTGAELEVEITPESETQEETPVPVEEVIGEEALPASADSAEVI